MLPSLPDPAFLDANIPIFAAGKPSPLQANCKAIMQAVADQPGAVATSAEVLQELLHVYLRRGELETARELIRNVHASLTGAIVAVSAADIVAAAALDVSPRLQARDRVHLAVMQRLGISRIISSDRALDEVSSIERLDPRVFPTWRDDVFPAAQR